jgi:hypothetical protein
MFTLPSRLRLQPGQHVRLRDDPKGAVGVVVEASAPPSAWALVRWADAENTVEPMQALAETPKPLV